MSRRLPIISAPIGDPAGIGPEVCVSAIDSGALDDCCQPLLIGDVTVVERAARVVKARRPVRRVSSPAEIDGNTSAIHVLHYPGPGAEAYPFGQSSAACGNALIDWLLHGMQLGAAGAVEGVIMAPIDTESLVMTGRYPDADALQPENTFMLRIAGPLRLMPISEHVLLSEAIELAQPDRVLRVIRLLHENLVRWGLPAPRIAVAGINPHAQFPQDQERIGPAVAAARAQGINVQGPLVPDTVFRQSIEGRFDAVVTMFHDQGQIVIKTVGFEGACTIYVGLPYVMLSVPHGSAHDIAGRGVAQNKSMTAAFRTAASLASGKGIPI